MGQLSSLGSLFTGSGGLDLGVMEALHLQDVAWVSDVEPGPRKVLRKRLPTTPNLGNVETWAA